jgi:ParB family transcriptional regulator, chromosome partitioning protein
VPHASPGQFAAHPHRPPAHQPQTSSVPLAESETAAASKQEGSQDSAPARVKVLQIDSNPAQPRKEFAPDDMQSLADSISTHGLLQPVVVRQVHDRYQLVAGERRLRAAIQAGWVDVPVNVIKADDRQLAELAIVENLHRKDLNPLEKAASFQKYLEQYHCTQEELASRLKLDRSTIANLIRLLELPEPVQDSLRRGKLTQGHARALLPLGDEREQIEFAQRIQREGLSVRQTEAMVQETIDAADREPLAAVEAEAPAKPGRSPRAKNEHLAALEHQFRAALGMKVRISHNARGRGKLVVQFRNHEEFERLKKHICGG